MVQGIGHVAFNVKDMDRTVAFYEQTLGFRRAFDIPRPENGEPWIVYLYGGGGQFIELFYGATRENPYRDASHGCAFSVGGMSNALLKAKVCS